MEEGLTQKKICEVIERKEARRQVLEEKIFNWNPQGLNGIIHRG